LLEGRRDEEPEILQQNVGFVDLTVIDHYDRGPELETPCRGFSRRLMVLDDLPVRPHDCDLLLDQTLGRQPLEYQRWLSAEARCLTGSSYALLRPQFAAMRDSGRAIPRKKLRRVLIMLGAGSSALEGWLLRTLEALEQGVDFDFVSASVPAGRRQLGNSTLTVYNHVANIAELMVDADLAIGAAGSASWERCCLGLPSLLYILAENQRHVCQALHQRGAAISVGEAHNPEPALLLATLTTLRQHLDRLARMSERAFQVCDGNGCGRVVQAVAEILDLG
jgi:spore coat polysaccharide biosynthesis predicted glycosyltransferase SpsG